MPSRAGSEWRQAARLAARLPVTANSPLAAALAANFGEMVGRLGFSSFLLFAITERGASALATDIPHDWLVWLSGIIDGVRHQEARQVRKRSRAAAKPFWWSDEGIESELRDMERFKEIGTDVLTVPVHENGSLIAAVHLAAPVRLPLDGADMRLVEHASGLVARTMVSGFDDQGSDLTPKEVQVLDLISDGNTSESIAETLRISVHTVNTYIRNVCEKLEAANRTQAVAKAIRSGIIS